MSRPLLLDEMLSQRIAGQLGERGHDVRCVVTESTLLALPDDQLLAEATRHGRALVTLNIKDFARLDTQYRADGRSHAGIVFVSTKAFPQDSRFVGAVVGALDKLLHEPDRLGPDLVLFLQR
ncbi:MULTISPECIES: DUF5615 family PIN-like protein [Pseudofrankia]|uniref:DUF5615 family PIN-like protein n=1 Tax=Pseudofrankia TaxID=2994363 RepID=UPI000234BEC5|nr:MULTISPECIES: DUF5615 family PIN-like protein [Pseudofrankia]OHV42021.1 hypothetical protein BCD49_00185 [Pseudofrankia sp. EUN1h]